MGLLGSTKIASPRDYGGGKPSGHILLIFDFIILCDSLASASGAQPRPTFIRHNPRCVCSSLVGRPAGKVEACTTIFYSRIFWHKQRRQSHRVSSALNASRLYAAFTMVLGDGLLRNTRKPAKLRVKKIAACGALLLRRDYGLEQVGPAQILYVFY